jgi:hypothetical protein
LYASKASWTLRYRNFEGAAILGDAGCIGNECVAARSPRWQSGGSYRERDADAADIV